MITYHEYNNGYCNPMYDAHKMWEHIMHGEIRNKQHRDRLIDREQDDS